MQFVYWISDGAAWKAPIGATGAEPERVESKDIPPPVVECLRAIENVEDGQVCIGSRDILIMVPDKQALSLLQRLDLEAHGYQRAADNRPPTPSGRPYFARFYRDR